MFARIPPFIPASVDGILTPQIVEAQQSIYVQRAGRSEMHSSELLRGFPIPKGAQLNPLGTAAK